jgi:hypothetical protein
LTATVTVDQIAIGDLPKLGESLASGLFAGLITTAAGVHSAIVLLPDKPAEALTWKKAVAWAQSVGGELPSRAVAAALFANAKDQFEPAWHWTGESFDDSYAWYQGFHYGCQFYYHKSYEGRARAVRLIPLNP